MNDLAETREQLQQASVELDQSRIELENLRRRVNNVSVHYRLVWFNLRETSLNLEFDAINLGSSNVVLAADMVCFVGERVERFRVPAQHRVLPPLMTSYASEVFAINHDGLNAEFVSAVREDGHCEMLAVNEFGRCKIARFEFRPGTRNAVLVESHTADESRCSGFGI